MAFVASDANGLQKSAIQNAPEGQLWSRVDVQPRCRGLLNAEQRVRLERFAFEHATSAESYDIVISNGSYLETPCKNGVISVLPHGRCWHASGSVMAPDELKPEMVRWLKRVCDSQQKTLAVYSVGADEAPLFVDAGFEVSKFGEEPLLDLGLITWQGQEFEWVRRQTNFCRRAGLEVVEVSVEAERRALSDELIEIMHEDLMPRTYPKPLRLLEGQFDPLLLFRRRLFVARSKTTGRIEGFLACSPMYNGKSWAFETYRKRQESPRGTIPFLFRTVIDRLQADGVRNVSLCLVPGRGLDINAKTPSSKMVSFAMSLWYKRLNFLFNTKGQDYFKSRFRPRYADRYICVTPKTSVRSMISFLVATGGIRPHLGNLIRNLSK